MKKMTCFFASILIFSAVTYCDTYLMWGGNLGYANMAGNNGFYHGTFFDTLYYPFDGPIGIGLDLKLQFPFVRYKEHEYLYGHYRDKEIQGGHWGIDFIAAPTLSLRLASFSLKAFPIFAYSIHPDFDFVEIDGQTRGNVKEPYIGGGAEICWSGQIIEGFLTGSYGQLMHTKEKYFSIGLGIRCFSRIKSLQERKMDKERILEEQKRQAEYAAQQEQIRQQEAKERQEAESSAIKSGSLDNMINFLNQYGDSENIRLAIERYFSENKNQPYMDFEITYVDNPFDSPYSFEKGNVYYASSTDSKANIFVYQWLSKYSFLAKVTNAPFNPDDYDFSISRYYKTNIIYIEGLNLEKIKEKKITGAFLKANGVYEYNSAAGSLNIVPKFTLMLFDVGKENSN